MEITHRTNNLRIAPRKLRLVADQIRYFDANKAIGVLNVVPNKGAGLIAKSLKSAIQVASDNNLDISSLVIQRVFVDEGMSLKRMTSRSRGRMSRITKKYSHLSLVLKGEEATKSRRRPAKTEKATETVAATPDNVTEE
jgi:large subunit ribosomal protein L22